MVTVLVCKPVPTLQTLLERSGAYCTSEEDTAADSAARSEFKTANLHASRHCNLYMNHSDTDLALGEQYADDFAACL